MEEAMKEMARGIKDWREEIRQIKKKLKRGVEDLRKEIKEMKERERRWKKKRREMKRDIEEIERRVKEIEVKGTEKTEIKTRMEKDDRSKMEGRVRMLERNLERMKKEKRRIW